MDLWVASQWTLAFGESFLLLVGAGKGGPLNSWVPRRLAWPWSSSRYSVTVPVQSVNCQDFTRSKSGRRRDIEHDHVRERGGGSRPPADL